jgi:hypothetical protein
VSLRLSRYNIYTIQSGCHLRYSCESILLMNDLIWGHIFLIWQVSSRFIPNLTGCVSKSKAPVSVEVAVPASDIKSPFPHTTIQSSLITVSPYSLTMTIVHRSNPEHADTLPTAYKPTPRTSSLHTQSWLAEQTEFLRCESSRWTEAVCPPVSEMKVVMERLYADADMSITNIFKTVVPVWIFGCVLMLGVWVSQQRSRRTLEQKAAAIMVGDVPFQDIEWGQITKPFLWWTFGGLLGIYIVFTAVGNAIGRFVKAETTTSNLENAQWQSSGSGHSSTWEPNAVDLYSAMFRPA